MTDHDELRALAEAAKADWPTTAREPWYSVTDFAQTFEDPSDVLFLAAVSPDVVVGLLDEIAELRAAHAQAVDELRLWGAATVTQSDTGHGRARLGGAA